MDYLLTRFPCREPRVHPRLNSLGDAGMVVKGTLIAVGAGIVLWRVWRLDRDPRNAEPLSG